MWPWGHLAVGYLVYAGLVWYRERRAPGDVAALSLALGTQAPDLVDKPLGWYLGVLPGGRALAHSVFAVVFVVGVVLAERRARGPVGVWGAFATGYVSHVAADTLYPLTRGAFGELSFLAWPVLPVPVEGGPVGLLPLLRDLSLTPFVAFELAVTGLAIALWYRQGLPGLAAVRGWIWRRMAPDRS